MKTHTDECKETVAALTKLRDDYVKQYPNYCKVCFGEGRVIWFENQAPYDTGEVWHEELWDYCGCVTTYKCPRCGTGGQAVRYYDDEGAWPPPCWKCGFQMPNDDPLPDVAGCYCEEFDWE